MEFDTATLEILSNFSTINPSLRFTKGTILRTVSPQGTILAKASIPDTIDDTFVIGDLKRFMSALSLFETPEIEIKENYCVLVGGNNRLEYVFTSPQLIKKFPPENDLKLKNIYVAFTMTNVMLQSIKKAMAILSIQEMAIIGRDGHMKISAFDNTGMTKDNYAINVAETDKEFQVVIRGEDLKLLPLDYEVEISSDGLMSLRNPKIQYWIASVEENTKFDV